MKLDFMSASEAKAIRLECAVTGTDDYISKIVREINEKIAYAAQKGRFVYKTRVDDISGMAELKSLSKKDQESIVFDIINALRDAGYTVEALSNLSCTGYLHITIRW